MVKFKYTTPKSETAVKHLVDKNGLQYVITQNGMKTLYYVYRIDDGKLIKLDKNKNPDKLDEIIFGA